MGVAAREFERPFVLLSYTTSHSQLVLRSRVGDDVLDVLPIDVRAMRLRTSYDRLAIREATGPERRAIQQFARIPEPYDSGYHYLTVGDGFVVAGNVHVLHNGEPYELTGLTNVEYQPVGERVPVPHVPQRFGTLRCTTAGHDLVLRSSPPGTELVFRGVREMKVVHFFDALVVTDEGDGRYTLTDGDREGHVVCASLEAYRDRSGIEK